MADTDLSPAGVARLIDISAVQAAHTDDDVRDLAHIAAADGFQAAHVLPTWVPLLRELLDTTTTRLGTPVGFPSGGTPSPLKAAEADWLIMAGVDELDVVINIGRLRAGSIAWVRDDLRTVVDVTAGRVPLRVVLETAYLDADQLRRGCEAALSAGIPALKTGTGWAGHTTTADEVAIIRASAGPDAEIKASGGIRTLDDIRRLLDAGATRFGVNTEAATRLVAEARGDAS